MKLIKLIKNLLVSLYSSLKRFPAAIGFSTAASIVLILLNHTHQDISSDTKDMLGRIAMVLVLGIPVSLCIKLGFERKGPVKAIVKIAAYTLGAGVLIFYYFFLLTNFKMVPISRYTALSLALYLAFLFIPYFFRRDGFELYVIKLFTRFCTAVIYSIVLYLGMAAILFTVDKLLGVPVSEKLYLNVWIAIVGVFAPSFFLAGVPGYEQQLETTDYPWLLRVLLLYIVMPIVSIYTAILYIYFVKVIFTHQWPVGLVAHLVLWYSVISAIVIFFISPLKKQNRWIRLFVFWLPKLILPLIVMMFISIGIRVRAYGITENRYFAIVLGLWAFGIMAYLSLSRVQRNILLPISLSLIAVLAVFGPWSSYSVSKLSQNLRFESILSRNSMLQDGKVVKPGTGISEEDKKELSQILKYFSNSHQLSDIRVLPENFKIENTSEVFGFPFTEYSYDTRSQRYFSYSSDVLDKPVDIKGYDYFLLVRNYSPASTPPDRQLEVKYDPSSYEIRLLSEGKEIYKKSLLEFGKQLHQKHGTTNRHGMSPDELTFTDENERVGVKIILQNLNGSEDAADKEIKINSMDFYLLVDLK